MASVKLDNLPKPILADAPIGVRPIVFKLFHFNRLSIVPVISKYFSVVLPFSSVLVPQVIDLPCSSLYSPLIWALIKASFILYRLESLPVLV